jgi:hypothetical protein
MKIGLRTRKGRCVGTICADGVRYGLLLRLRHREEEERNSLTVTNEREGILHIYMYLRRDAGGRMVAGTKESKV